jgi:hypothetical protein
MDASELEDLRFPIGRHAVVGRFDRAAVDEGIAAIAALPEQVRARLAGLGDSDLDRRYRPGGWTVRQVVHHLADSHVHSYVRFKWALTEDTPLIKAYDEARWADLPDCRGPVEPALDSLAAVHARWTALLRCMSDADFGKAFVHPETGETLALFDRVAAYAWHGRHHLAHIGLALRA